MILNKKDLTIEFNSEILWLQRYFKSTLKKMIADRREELRYPFREKNDKLGIKSNKQATPRALQIIIAEEEDPRLQMMLTWEKVICDYVNATDESLLRVIKAVFVTKSMNISGAGRRYMYYGKTTTYKMIYEWLQGLSIAYFKAK